MKINTKVIKICNIACVVLLLALIVLQFMPYWYGTSEQYWSAKEYASLSAEELQAAAEKSEDGVYPISLAKACWFPEHDDLTFITHAVILLLGGVAIFFCVKNWNSTLSGICPLVVGGAAVMEYFFNPVMALGQLWLVHAIIAAAILVPAVILLVFHVGKMINWLTKIDA